MIHVAPRLERRRRCLAMLVPRVAADRDVEKKARRGAERPSDGSRIHTRVCAARCCGCISGKARVNAGSVFLQLPPPPIDGTNPPRSVEPLRFFFPPLTKWQPCCRQPGSPVAFCARGGTGEASGSALFPPLRRGGLPSPLLWLEIQPRSGEWRTAMWAKKAKGLP